MDYIEIYRHEQGQKPYRVYQGVVFSPEDGKGQMNLILKGAIENKQTVVEKDARLWEIFNKDGSMWGRVQLRAL